MNDREHKSADEIEREIHGTENEIARTLDILQHKLSPGAVVDTLLRTSRENGAEFAANFGRSVRDNPLPITLIGTGLAWLMMSRRGNGGDHHKLIDYSVHRETHDAARPEREDAHRIYREGVYTTEVGNGGEGGESYPSPRDRAAEAVRTTTTRAQQGASGARENVEHGMSDLREGATSAASGASAAARRAEERAREAAHTAQERARSLGDRAGESARDARSAAGEAYSGARSGAGEAYAGARSAAEDAYSGARSAAGEAYSGARSAADRAYSGARSAGEHAAEHIHAGSEAAYRRGSDVAHRTTARLSNTASAIGSSLRENPLVAGAVLAGIGALVGALLPTTRRENELMGEHSDAVKAQAVDAAGHQAERIRDVAVAAAEGARREAEARGLTPDAVTETAEHEIRHLAESGREIARAAMREGEAAAKGERPENEEKQSEDKRTQDKRNEDKRDEDKRGEQSKDEATPDAGPISDAGPVYSRMQAAPSPGPGVPPASSGVKPAVTPPPAKATDPLKRDK